MKVTIREYDKEHVNYYKTWKIVDSIRVETRSLLSIDASTTNTGVSIISFDGSVRYTCSLHREDGESAVEYKLAYKNWMKELLKRELLIENIWYEEHFVGYVEAAKVLFMLRSTIEEILIEEKLKIVYKEISNKKWKRYLFEMCNYGKCPTGTELEKKAIKECLVAQMPCLNEKGVTQDELDSLGVGMVALVYGNKTELESKKKPKKFNYEARFYGGDEEDDSDFFMIFGDGTGIVPKKIAGQGCLFHELNGREKFDNAVYRELCDEDLPLILRFNSNKYGDIVLRENLGELTEEYKYIYAVVWRKTRKKV
jgi:hypothetical protein